MYNSEYGIAFPTTVATVALQHCNTAHKLDPHPLYPYTPMHSIHTQSVANPQPPLRHPFATLFHPSNTLPKPPRHYRPSLLLPHPASSPTQKYALHNIQTHHPPTPKSTTFCPLFTSYTLSVSKIFGEEMKNSAINRGSRRANKVGNILWAKMRLKASGNAKWTIRWLPKFAMRIKPVP